MRSERTELTFLRDSARVVYRSRLVLSNPGSKRQVELRVDFSDAGGYYDYATGSLYYGATLGAPTFAVRVDNRPVATRCDTVGNLFRFRWLLGVSRRGAVTVDAAATFPWTPDDCVYPDYRMEWRPADDGVFSVSNATREMVFRFDPAISLMAVDSWTDGGQFEGGAVAWLWHGHGIERFDVSFDSWLAEEHTDLFPGRYPLPKEEGYGNDYFEIFSRNCEISDLELDGGKDSLSAQGRAWVEQARSECRWAISWFSRRHSLAPLDTSSSAVVPPLAQPGLGDSALSALNAVERRNLRYAVGLMWALDLTRNAPAILQRTARVRPGR